MIDKTIVVYIITLNLDKMVVLPKGLLLFVFLPLKGKQIKN